MPIRVALHHKTTYTYDRLVQLSPQVIRLRPAPHSRTPVTAYSLKIEPKGHFLNWQQDPHSNYLARVVFPERVRDFTVEVDLVAELTVVNPFDFFLEPYADKFPFRYEPGLQHELTPFLAVGAPGPEVAALLKTIDLTPQTTIDFLVGINQKLQRAIKYVIRMEPGVQSSEDTLKLASGSCRDSAWLLVELLRHLGLAARFVSGFLIQLKPDIKSLDGPVGADSDFTDLHAWTEVYLPGAGWVGMDPTSGLFAGEGHIPLAATPEPSSAAPVSGAVDACEVSFGHEMAVWRVLEDPRVTLPYTDQQWERILALGCQVDREICTGDIRLTMGGEPTFVSIDNMEGEEWNTAALGPEKRLLAGRLLDRLTERFASGGLLHYGQGKWYPGEPLPRWALACYWRTDGVPLWQNRELLARDEVNSKFSVTEAERFAQTLASRLGLDPGYVMPAFENEFYHLHQERQLPINVEPAKNQLEDPLERERIRRVFEQGLNTPVGMVLPLQRTAGKSGSDWQTGSWMLRGERLYLLPGDSPVGLRLPLPSLPWVNPKDIPEVHEPDPAVLREPLPVPKRGVAIASPP
jgi:transglutaminase-like putative cysteine protease